MGRVVLFAVIFALGTGAVAFPAGLAHAQEKKGFFSNFFNRQGHDGSDGGTPIHMGASGAQTGSSGSDVKAYGFGKSSPQNVPRYEDSPINAERVRQAANLERWNKEQLAEANASTQALVAQMVAEQQYNEQAARQQQAQLIAELNKAGSDPAAIQAAYDNAYAQPTAPLPGTVGSSSSATVTSPTASEAPAPEKAKREPRSQGLFNRITD